MIQRFTYARGIAPMLWVFVALASIELIVVHFLIALWRRDVAIILSIATLASTLWLIRAIRSFGRLPVMLDGETLMLRVGTIRTILAPVAAIAGVRTDWPPGFLRQPGVANMALIAHPNVIVDLDPPQMSRRRPIRSVAHRLDDPAAFVAALQTIGRVA